MADIQILDSVSSGCKAAVLPVIVQPSLVTFDDSNDGVATPTVIENTSSETRVPFGGTFVNKGCADLIASISYVSGGDCDSCDGGDTLVEAVVTWTINSNSVTKIPEGFWTSISYVLSEAANETRKQYVGFQSAYTPDCPSCAILYADIVIPG